MKNGSYSNCNIGIQVCPQSTDPFYLMADNKGSTPCLRFCEKCEKCLAGKFSVTSNTMTHFFSTELLFCLHASVCCCLRQLLEASLCTLWMIEVLGSYFFLNRPYTQWFDFYLYIQYMNLPSTLWEQLHRKFTLHKFYLATKAKSKKMLHQLS